MNKIDIKCIAQKGAVIPQYKTCGAAGSYLCDLLEKPLTIACGKAAIVPTGLFF